MKRIVILLLLCGFTVHDGDTITKISYRMAYIDAPEFNQTCHAKGVEIPIGKQATNYLEHTSKGRLADCKVIDTDRYGREVVDCGFNLKMVRRGFAVCYDKYIKDPKILEACHDARDAAWLDRLGIWQCDDFITPSDYRHKQKN